MTTVIDVVDMGYAFTALVVVIGVLLIAGAYVNYTRNNIPLAMLCGGTLLMLISPLLAIIILAVAAIIIAIGGDTRNALMTVLLAVIAYILSLVIIYGTTFIATAAGVI